MLVREYRRSLSFKSNDSDNRRVSKCVECIECTECVVWIRDRWIRGVARLYYARFALEKLLPGDGSAMSIVISIESPPVRRTARDNCRIIA